MSTVIYLANQYVQAVVGTSGAKRVGVRGYYDAVAPEGSIINGMITDSELFIGFLKEFWQTNRLPAKDVTLVVNSTKFVGKSVEMPPLSRAKTVEYIEREFADVRKGEESIYGYIPLSSENPKMKRYYAEAVPPDFIQEYIDIFREAGVSLRGVYSGESSLISMTNATVGSLYSTFVLEIASGAALTMLLWVNGSFYYFNTIRCFHEPGTADYAADVARSISQIVQFMQAHQIEHPLQAIVLAGLNESDVELYRRMMSEQGIAAPVDMFDGRLVAADAQNVQSHLHAVSGLYVSGSQHNYLIQYQHAHKKKEKTKSSSGGFLGVGIVCAVMILLFVGSLTLRLVRQSVLTTYETYNNDPTVEAQIIEYDATKSRNAFLTRQYEAITDIDANIVTYPVGNSKVLETLANCADGYATLEFQSFDADAGSLSMTASSGTVEEINAFIRLLTEQDIFNSVDYTGYSYDEETELWDIHVTCTLAEAAGR